MSPAPTLRRRLERAWIRCTIAASVAVGLASTLGCGARASTHAAAAPAADGRLFTALPSSYTGVRFENRVTESETQNVFTYRNFYNGGGVALGDLTGDGLPEMVLTSNQGGPRLYVNEGHFRFRDVTDASGLRSTPGSWTTGVTFADVNGDGRLDIYICKAGPGEPASRANELWINQGVDADGVPHFTEQAKAYGIADEGWSTQAVFFDYDRDGRLDLLVINNSPKPVTGFGVFYSRNVPDPYSGAKLYHNDGARAGDGGGHAHFTEVTQQAGIYSPQNAFGLGVAVGDVNGDGWPDIYVSNDFFERDYLYVNKGDGTFAEVGDRAMPVMSQFSMGLDVADLDNDGRPDVYTTDMLPEDEHRLRTMAAFDGWDVYQSKVRNGYGHQLMRNMLQHNNGDGTFSDVAWMSGVARTDWSWGALIVDLDLDGRKDIFVTNGVARDVTSQDYIAFSANEHAAADRAAIRREPASLANGGGPSAGDPNYLMLTKAMPSTRISNYAFHNLGDLRFTNEAHAWGLDTPSFSSGAAYADLDGDGAPDLVVNNVNGEAFVYRNNARAEYPDRHFLQVALDGTGMNRFGIGARVTLRVGTTATGDAASAGAPRESEILMQEEAPTRGFESSVDQVLTFGLGAHARVDTLRVDWPDGRRSTMTGVAANQRLTVHQAQAAPGTRLPARPPLATHDGGLLAPVADSTAFPFVHRAADFVDFDRELLIPKRLSTEGPALATADVNGDGLDDVYIGGGKGQGGRVMLQQADGRFVPGDTAAFAGDADCDDVGAVFFDANGDGHPDLYVVSGGSAAADSSPELRDRLYLNDGHGHFRKAPPKSLPPKFNSGSRAVAADYDGDGRPDLFVGGRLVPGRYGIAPRSMLLRNDGPGPDGVPHFTDVTDRLAPELAHVGMVTDAVWKDVDGDGRLDLVVVGEWMSITVFRNEGGGRLKKLTVPGLARSNGWWNRIVAGDFTGHGRTDFIVGNLGLNTRLQATATAPATMWVKDFVGGGISQQIVATFDGSQSWPLPLRDDMIRSIPRLKSRFLSYKDYAQATVGDVFPPADLAGAVADTAFTFASVLVRNDGPGADGKPRFTVIPLPREAQVAPVYGILAADVDGDGRTDLLLAGNFDGFKPEIGRAAASYGLVLRGDPSRCRADDRLCVPFTPMRAAASGFFVPGQTRDIRRVRTRAGDLYVVARNGDRPLLFRARPHPDSPPQVFARVTNRRASTRGG